jgi:site-specific DNA-cytosine methylase
MSAPPKQSAWLAKRRSSSTVSSGATREVKRTRSDEFLENMLEQQLREDGLLADGADPDSMSKLIASSIRDGNLLDMYAHDAARTLHKFNGFSKDVPATLTYATMCSGGDITSFAMQAASQAIEKIIGKSIKMQQLWACEVSEQKRRFLQALHRRSLCIFVDARFLSKGTAFCETHHRHCPVSPASGLITGFSCKDISRANHSSSKSKLGLLNADTSPGGSADTFGFMLKYIDFNSPDWLVLENSDALCDGAQTNDDANINILLAELGSRGYESQAMLVNTCNYGLPNRRPRTYIVAVKLSTDVWQIHNVDSFFKVLVQNMDKCKRSPADAKDLLLDNSHPLVAAQLSTRMSKEHSGWEAGSIDIHQKHYAKVGIRWGSLKPSQAMKDELWFDTLTSREQDCVLFAMRHFKDAQCADVSQSIYRLPHSSLMNGACISPALLPRNIIWWFHRHRAQIGFESLMMAGYPITSRRDLSEFSDDLLQDLAGNSFSGTVILSILLSMCSALPWMPTEASSSLPEASSDVASEAMLLLRQL